MTATITMMTMPAANPDRLLAAGALCACSARYEATRSGPQGPAAAVSALGSHAMTDLSPLHAAVHPPDLPAGIDELWERRADLTPWMLSPGIWCWPRST